MQRRSISVSRLQPQSVESPALAIMVPLLIRGLRHNETPIKRKTVIIIANMVRCL